MDAVRDFYGELDVPRTADAEEIRRAYRRLARLHHPDLCDAPGAAARFAAITEAYETLADPGRRRAYDRVTAGYHVTAFGAGRPGGADTAGGFVDVIDHAAFRGVATADPAARAMASPEREHRLRVSFLTAARGGIECLAAPGAHGERDAAPLEVRVPPGTEDGAVLHVPRRGRGDLAVRVEVGTHPIFRRRGLDLHMALPLTIAEATLGATVRIPLLARTAALKIAPGTTAGKTLRLRGAGIHDDRGHRGDMLATVVIDVPAELSERARTLMEALSGELQNPRDRGRWTPGRE